MEIRHLKYFLKVAEELNFSRAAEKLFISQPPLSRQIKELEEELGARLFNRSNKKVELTEAGRYFEKECRTILSKLEKASITAKKIATNINGKFRIGYISSTFSETLTQLIAHLTAKYPFVNFRLYEVPTAKQVAALEQGKLDLGILRAPLYSPNINVTHWFYDSYSLIYNKNHLKVDSSKDLGKLKNERFIFFNKDYAPHFYSSLIQICAFFGFSPNVVHEANNIGSIIQLVKNGLGVSIVPSSNAKNYVDETIGFLELEEVDLQTEVLLATPKSEKSEVTREAVGFVLGN